MRASERGSVFHQRRIARYLLLLAVLLSPFPPLGVPVLLMSSFVGLAWSKRWPMLMVSGGAVCVPALLAFAAIVLPPTGSEYTEALILFPVATFAMVSLSAPMWPALAFWRQERPLWQLIAYGFALVLVALGLPLLSLSLLGMGAGLVVNLGAAALLALCCWPLIKVLPPLPELLPLVQALQLEAENDGWRGDGVFIGRRGQLTLSIPFATPIPGLFATKRGQSSKAQSRPLLGDAVLDSTLELSLPESLAHLAEQPALLLEAVHGAQAQVSEHAVSLNRQLDKDAFKADPYGARDQILSELHAVRELAQRLQEPSD